MKLFRVTYCCFALFLSLIVFAFVPLSRPLPLQAG
jgi:hypothetical protein